MKTKIQRRRSSIAEFKNPYRAIHSVLWGSQRRTQEVDSVDCTAREPDGSVCARTADKNSGLCYKHEQERGLAE